MQEIFLFMQHHWELSTCLLIVLALLLLLEFLKQKYTSNQLSVSDAVKLINHENASVIDVRAASNFKEGHIIGAISYPLDTLEQSVKKLGKFKNKPLIVVCANGSESTKATAILLKQGLTSHILQGGIQAWRAADMPLIKD